MSTLAPDIRASLALFCYRRSHLHSMGLGIAASCDKDNLVRAGGSVGAFLFASSREVPQQAVLSPRGNRRKITLATGVLPDGFYSCANDLVGFLSCAASANTVDSPSRRRARKAGALTHLVCRARSRMFRPFSKISG